MKETFTLSGQYGELFRKHHIDIVAALKKARLPEGLFYNPFPVVKVDAYFALMEAISRQLKGEAQVIQLAASDNIEMFSPPIFAAYSSRDGRQFLERLATYKRLVCPLEFRIEDKDGETSLQILLPTPNKALPAFLVQSEFVFVTALLRRATREAIDPLAVTLPGWKPDGALARFFRCPLSEEGPNEIRFRQEDLSQPFISRNDAMWDFLEPELRRRLAEMQQDSSWGERVQAALVEILPRGESTIETVADKLGLSARSLQRFLRNEGTTFQKALAATRLALARNYLQEGTLTSADMAYLLGYQETSTFLRAFRQWTGISMSQYKARESLRLENRCCKL